MEDFIVSPTKLGAGSYGDVYKVRSKANPENVFAMKVFRPSVRLGSSHGLLDSTVRELSCLFALRGHPHIVQMNQVLFYKEDVAVLMGYYPYTLFNVITQRSPAPTSIVARISLQIAEALAYMHDLNWIHRDLTASNVMLTEDLTVKVGDMGLSRNVADWMSGETVTAPYRAPELFTCDDATKSYTNAIDMWSLGVLIAELLEHRVWLFRNKRAGRIVYTTSEILQQVFEPEEYKKTGKKPAVFNIEGVLSRVIQKETAIKDVVFQLLTVDPGDRLTARGFLAQKRWRSLSKTVTPDEINVITTEIHNV
ncbi:serine/threonine-protein kinase ssn3-like [Austrofundulus limnaeus]|uniref:Serine/threonine-protein kinase ssn3-like n=1 Tax=Austrofundulus limnaeus TaxID=52670 RepID=A0A2I4BPN7_AUSLI|nr:PREDICTED: serine/threonine-protein kinase ssn3-like [Austrofundulus limnaeus]